MPAAIKKYAVVLWAALALLGAPACKANNDNAAAANNAINNSRLQTVFSAAGVVWSFAFVSPHELLVSFRDGRLLYANLQEQTRRQLPAPKVAAVGQGGLLDVHLQEYDGKRYVYVTYSVEVDGQAVTALARGEWTGQTIKNWRRLFAANVVGGGGRHFGSRLAFADGHIFMTIGDRGERDYAQDLARHNGKILRLTPTGEAAAGNPFASKAGALAEIWSYGHRNPQGIVYDSETGGLYAAEFGPRGGDELNLVEAGKNYGWPLITYGREYYGPKIGKTAAPGMEQPLTHWTPSISPSGMALYVGDKIPQWRGNLFLAALSDRHLRRVQLSKNGSAVAGQEALFADINERVRHVRGSPDGHLYFSTDSGKIIRVLPQ